jgi:AAHS family benzoate transporter-like MFS transporter
MLGPTLGGVLLAADLQMQFNFLAFAIPGIIAAITLGLVSGKRAYGRNELDGNNQQDDTETVQAVAANE